MSENLELPLKTPHETFTDEPSEIDDVNIHDLVIDIEAEIKDINKLHSLQAVAILLHTLEDIMKLNANPELFDKFRVQQLRKRNIDLATMFVQEEELTSTSSPSTELSTTNDNETHNEIRRTTPSNSPPNSPPLKVLKTDSDFGNLKDTTPDSLAEENEFITIESLIESTDLNESKIIDFDDITEEVKYYHNHKIIDQNEHVIKNFNLVKPPNLSVEQFLNRIRTYSPSTSVSCYVHAALLIFKLSVLHNVLPLTLCNVHRIILALIRCLTKKLEDIYQKQKTFATVGGLTVKELFRIEVAFLFLCNFRLVVGEDSLNNYLKEFSDLRNFVKGNIDEVK